jgi:protein-disulfide isomerase
MIAALCTLLVAAQVVAAPAAAATTTAGPRPVEIVLYSDFQCPFCALFAQPLRDVQRTGVDGVAVNVTFKHFPLPLHPRAPLAHRAAQAAAEQGRFWEMHDLLFANQRRVERGDLAGYARQLGLDVDRFERDMNDPRTAAAIEADARDGRQLGVNGTPTFYVNGREYSGAMSADQLKRLVVAAAGDARSSADVPDASTSLGPAGAPVVIELFADLRSPITRLALEAINGVLARRPEAVRVQFRHLPLAFHADARLAHEAAAAAAAGGRFWNAAAYLVDHAAPIGQSDLLAMAARLGLDASSFTAALGDHRYAARIEADLQSGQRRGIRGSPAIVVNGRRIDGVPTVDTLCGYVDAALAARSQPDQPRKP